VTTEANGGPAIALYERDEDRYRFTGLHLLVVHEEKITTITAFMDAALAGRFHLPAELHA
jgi:hypothetical protein